MKTIGEILKEARIKKKVSIEKLAKITNIKKEYIKAIEREDWGALPEKAVVAGFIDSISGVLNISKGKQKALFRRDYPSVVGTGFTPKLGLKEGFTWSPKLTLFLGILVICFLVLGYLVYQYINFVKPPVLLVELPKEGEIVETARVLVKGKTTSDATVTVNNQPVVVSDNGEFETEVEVFKETNEILVQARSRSGKESVVRRKIIPKLGD